MHDSEMHMDASQRSTRSCASIQPRDGRSVFHAGAAAFSEPPVRVRLLRERPHPRADILSECRAGRTSALITVYYRVEGPKSMRVTEDGNQENPLGPDADSVQASKAVHEQWMRLAMEMVSLTERVKVS